MFGQDVSLFNERETLFITVVLPLSLGINYTYRVPFELNDEIAIGKRVVVQFGRSKIYTAIVKEISNQAPQVYEAKYIIDVVDAKPIVTTQQFLFWEWLSAYYLCNLGEVMGAALPSSLKLASETVLMLAENFPVDVALNDKETILVDALRERQRLTMDEVAQLLGQKSIFNLVNSLIAKDCLEAVEEMVDKYKALKKSFVCLAPFYQVEENLRQLFDLFAANEKRLNLLLAYIKLRRSGAVWVAKEDLLNESAVSAAVLKTLVDKEIFIIEKQAVSRLQHDESAFDINFQLSDAQQTALNEIQQSFQTKDVVLLHGVTAAGKTQLYIKLIEEALKTGGQALFLLPEIALTTQIVERIKYYFGAKIGVYHSKFNDSERVEIWNKVLDGDYQIVLGARSALFLPFKDLRLIIVDEEHENSYKQQHPAPRYQARDAAIYLAHLFKAKVVLGSATPSIESYYNAQQGKYGLVTLTERFGGVQLPEHTVVSIADETKRKKMIGYFSSVLLEQIGETLANGEQVILFQNRRGYATILLCATCGYTPKCVNCDVSLTYHKASNKLHCHYCGYYQSSPKLCPACGSVHILHKGFGTERVEEELKLLFPDVAIDRLDLDSTRGKNSLQQIIAKFQTQKTSILIGTQMVAKGLDFDKVSLIGVISADTILNYPEFRAFERGFQLLAQVAGRAGRRDKQGRVCIQSYDVNHPIIQKVVANDYEAMYQAELVERERFSYPPFSRLIFVFIKHRDVEVLQKAATLFATDLKAKFGTRVLGPETPLVGKVQNLFIQQIIIKVERNAAIQKLKVALMESVQTLNSVKEFRGVVFQIDVDPN
jgi:primosomal protein N' (replication factor Y)